MLVALEEMIQWDEDRVIIEDLGPAKRNASESVIYLMATKAAAGAQSDDCLIGQARYH